jgi:hypothetical protein
MEAVQTVRHPQDASPPTFETVWAGLQEVRQILKDNAQGMKELRESQKETDRQISRLGSRIGQLIEHFAASNLLEKFEELKNDVMEHQDRMKIVREYADKRNDKRKYLAAIAGATVEGTAREYALASGIYVIEQTGDTVRVKEPPSLTYW